jgi:hypothetical protein
MDYSPKFVYDYSYRKVFSDNVFEWLNPSQVDSCLEINLVHLVLRAVYSRATVSYDPRIMSIDSRRT